MSDPPLQAFFDYSEAKKAITEFFPVGPASPREIRVLMKKAGPMAGWFNDPAQALEQIQKLTFSRQSILGVYITINPVPSKPSGLPENQITRIKQASGDGDIQTREFILVDFDIERAKDPETGRKPLCCSTDEEKAQALELARKVIHDLEPHGLHPCFMVDSGNGYHVFYRVSMETGGNGSRDTKLIQSLLQGLQDRYGTDKVGIDRSVYNPSRIVRLPGTCNQKGQNEPDRGWRLARKVQVWEEAPVASEEALEALVKALSPQQDEPAGHQPPHPAPEPIHSAGVDNSVHSLGISPQGWSEAQLNQWMAHWLKGLPLAKVEDYEGQEGSGKRWVYGACPFNDAHEAPHESDRGFAIIQFKDGGLAAVCHHDTCQGLGWTELRNWKEAGRLKISRASLEQEIQAWESDVNDPTGQTQAVGGFLLQALRLSKEAQEPILKLVKAKGHLLTLKTLQGTLKALRGKLRQVIQVDLRSSLLKKDLATWRREFKMQPYEVKNTDDGPVIQNFNHVAVADWTAQTLLRWPGEIIQHLMIWEHQTRTFMRYEEKTGIWRPRSEEDVRLGIIKTAEKMVANPKDVPAHEWNRSTWTQAKDILKSTLQAVLDQPRPGILHLQNGMLDLNQPEPVLLDFHPGFMSKNQLPWTWNPVIPGEAPQWLELISVLSEEDQKILQLFMGLFLMSCNYPQKILLLCGGAMTGKSTILEVIQGLLAGQVAELDTGKLSDTFAYQAFLGKTLLMALDQRPDFLDTKSAHRLKSLTGGGDLAVRIMYSGERGKIKGIFNAVADMNGIPVFKIDSDGDAWARRTVIIQFPDQHEIQRPEGWKPIPLLARKIMNEEGEAVFHWAIEGARMLMANLREKGEMVLLSETQQARVTQAIRESDPIIQFIEDCLEPGEGMSSKDIHGLYREWQYEQAGGHPGPGLTVTALTRKLRPLLPLEIPGSQYDKHQGSKRSLAGFRGIAKIVKE